MLSLILSDLRAKAIWCYEDESWRGLLKTLATDGTLAMVLYRLMQSSRKHLETAVYLWSYRPRGPEKPPFPELLLDAGVDLVLVGHTHTYERFVLEKGGRSMDLVNLSGRPRTAILWIGDGARRARVAAGFSETAASPTSRCVRESRSPSAPRRRW